MNLGNKHIFLNGFMGAGKSRIGPILADHFGRIFFDTDHIIEKKTGKKIFQIFEFYSEEYFRQLESEVIKEIIKKEPAIVALGGGSLVDEENRKSVHNKGVVIYVKSAPEEILKRVRNTRKRPLLIVPEGQNFEQNLFARINELLDERKDVYEQADLIVDRDGLEPPQIVELIESGLKEKYG